MAASVDGVVLRSKQKVCAHNYHQFHDELEEEITRAGYVCSIFQGENCVFIYSDGTPAALNKMADYALEYKEVTKRPIPFIPPTLLYHITDEAFAKRLETYKRIFCDATSIVDATSDDAAGGLAFQQFMSLLPYTEAKIYRARPLSMTQTSILEAFNSLEAKQIDDGFYYASSMHEALNWLINCNASNVLSVGNSEHQLLVIGRNEALILRRIAEQDILTSRQKCALRVKVLDTERKRKLIFETECEMTRKEAKELKEYLLYERAVPIENVQYHHKQMKINLLNAFDIQSKGTQQSEHSAKEIANAITWLFENGYITWPSNSNTIPWKMRAIYAEAIAMLSEREEYRDKIRPNDIDDYTEWDDQPELFGHTGVLVKGKPIPNNLNGVCKLIYDLIAASNVVAIKMVLNKENITGSINDARCNKIWLKAAVNSYVARSDHSVSHYEIHEKDILQVISVDVVPAEKLTEGELIADMSAEMDGKLFYSYSFLADAIENLIAWGQIKRNGDTLETTKRGKITYKYIIDTSLADPAASIVWDKKLSDLLTNDTPNVDIYSEISEYVKAISAELGSAIITQNQLPFENMFGLRCPLCGSSVRCSEEGEYRCSNSKCQFRIQRDINSHVITDSEVEQLLTQRYTDLITDFVSKKGMYSARLRLEKGKIMISFQSPYVCPICRYQLKEYTWGIKCSNENCSFSLNRKICGHSLSENEFELLLNNRKTEEIVFQKKDGTNFVASLSIKPDGGLDFAFPPRKKGKERKS